MIIYYNRIGNDWKSKDICEVSIKASPFCLFITSVSVMGLLKIHAVTQQQNDVQSMPDIPGDV